MAPNRTVKYVDFGIASAKQFWDESVIPAYEKFKTQPNPSNAFGASFHAWHVHEWIWHERHPGEDTSGNRDYEAFRKNCTDSCPELAWLRDVADAGKHRGLGRRSVEVRRVASERNFGDAHGTRPHGVLPPPVPIPLCITFD